MCSVGILIGWTGPRGTFDQMLNKARWQVELFFGWIKQHLRVMSSFRTSENAQIANLDRGARLCARCHHQSGSAYLACTK